ISEWRKFVACIVIARATGAGSVGMMSKKIDEVWHNAILFTREYFAFSEKLFGAGFYLHHAPVTKKEAVSDAPVKNVFADIYHQLFGMIPKIWGALYENSL